jgi:O-antigen/teichoic acid export membrane protein
MINLERLKRRAPRALLPWLEKIEASPLGRRLARGMFWSFSGAVLSRGLALIAGIVIARLLGKEIFGEFGIIQSTIMMFATYATVGVGITATKHIAELKVSDPARAGRIVVLSSLVASLSGTAVGLAMVVAAPLIATRLLAAPHLSSMVALSGLALVFTVVNEAQIGTMSGFEAFKRRSRVQTLGSLLSLPITVLAVYLFALKGAVVSLVLSNAILVAMNMHAIRSEARKAGIPLVWQRLREELGVLWRFGLPVLLSGAVYVPAMWAANLLLVNGPDGYEEMGVFSAADRWRTAIRFLPGLLGGVTMPILASLSGASRMSEFRRMLWRNVKLALFMSLGVAVPIALFSSWIMAAYGPGFTEGRLVLVILCGSATLYAGYWIMGQSFASRGQVWTMFRLNAGWATILIGLTWLLRHKGATGLALAYLGAETARLGFGFVACRRSLRGDGRQVGQTNVESAESATC